MRSIRGSTAEGAAIGTPGTEAAHAAAPGSMGFMRRFGAVTCLAVACAALATAGLISHFLAEEMLLSEAARTAEFVDTLARIQGGYRRSEFFEYMRALPGAVAISVHARDGTVLWSYRKEDVPRTQDEAGTRKLLQRIFALPHSTSYPAVARWDHSAAAAPGGTGLRYVENYVPLYDASDRVVAVVQIDKEPARLQQSIDRGRALVWALGIAGVLVCVALFRLARDAADAMHDQQRRLVESENLGAIGQMSLAVAHGIRNPLAAIRSSAEIALDEVAEPARGRLRDIVAQADRLSYWLRDLLQHALPASEQAQAVDVHDVLRESVDGFAPQLAQAGIAIDRMGMEAGCARVAASRLLLLHAFNGIISNAIEAMASGGRLVVRYQVERPRGIVSVAIADTGPGMSEERLAQAFQPFRTGRARGLGIGLSIVKATLERSGGKVGIESGAGCGTRVELVLPLAR